MNCASTNVMMADAEFNVIYMNDAVKRMFKDAESDLRQQLPDFDADDIMGNNIDIFHTDPAHQRHLLSALQDSYRNELEVGPRTFHIIANPVVNDEGASGHRR